MYWKDWKPKESLEDQYDSQELLPKQLSQPRRRPWVSQRRQLMLAFLAGAVTMTAVFWLVHAPQQQSEDPFSHELCNDQRECHELAWTASPRTPFSSRSVPELIRWFQFHDELVKDASAAAQTCRLLFLGDSITERIRGTKGYGRHCQDCQGVTKVFQKEFGALAPLALGISGDQTQHLLWRLQNGELPKHLHPEVVQWKV